MRKPAAIAADKFCEHCGGAYNRYVHPLTQRVIESMDKFLGRKYCGNKCSREAVANPNRRGGVRKKVIFDSDGDIASYYDSPEYQAYSKRVLKIVKRSRNGVTTADIHRVVGHELRHWTQDVLDGAGLEAIGVLPTRYKLGKGGQGIPPADAFQVTASKPKVMADLGL